MELGIARKHAVVTGASQGIGRAIASALAKEGVKVTAVARRRDKLDAVIDEIGGAAAGHIAIAADLMEAGEPARVVREAAERSGAIHITVHNVGGPLDVRDPLASMEEWSRVWRFNLGIAIEMNALLIPPMQAAKWGRVIHISSISAESVRGRAPYACAKAAVNAYVKGVGRAVAADGVVLAGVMPGVVMFEDGYWDSISKTNPAMMHDYIRHHQALGRFGTAEEVAHFVVFLCSTLASFAAADVLPIDGGTM